jgi:hypothetical protein
MEPTSVTQSGGYVMKFTKRFWFSVVLVVVLVPFLNAQQRTASSDAATTSAVSGADCVQAMLKARAS